MLRLWRDWKVVDQQKLYVLQSRWACVFITPVVSILNLIKSKLK
jgi:hypothetical protein